MNSPDQGNRPKIALPPDASENARRVAPLVIGALADTQAPAGLREQLERAVSCGDAHGMLDAGMRIEAARK